MKSIAVMPPARYLAGRRLWRALESVLPARFRPAPFGAWEGADGAVVFGPPGPGAGLDITPPRVPTITYVGRPDAAADGRPRSVRFSRSELLDCCLRGREITERSLPRGPESDGALPGRLLAEVEGGVAWSAVVREGVRADFSRYAAPDLSAGESLREHLADGDFLRLLPLIHFLRGATAAEDWILPPLRACFLFDDPNLHWNTYGYLSFDEVARSARAHGYHVSMAMVPLDAWVVWPETRRLFRSNRRSLSLAMHGAEHTKEELGRLDDDARAFALLACALRRASDFESRTRIAIDRVMAPPHGTCSGTAMRQMALLGFEAATASKPHPWLSHPPAGQRTLRWNPADFSAGGLPVLLRRTLCRPFDDLVFRAFLGQPLVIYAHHWDLAGRRGAGMLEEAAARVASLGAVTWSPLGRIASTNFSTRREGERLRVRLFSRNIALEVPEGVREVSVEADAPSLEGHGVVASGPAVAGGRFAADNVRVLIETGCRGGMKIALYHPDAAGPVRAEARGMRLWPYVRRMITAARDRLQPLLGLRVRASRGDPPAVPAGHRRSPRPP